MYIVATLFLLVNMLLLYKSTTMTCIMIYTEFFQTEYYRVHFKISLVLIIAITVTVMLQPLQTFYSKYERLPRKFAPSDCDSK